MDTSQKSIKNYSSSAIKKWSIPRENEQKEIWRKICQIIGQYKLHLISSSFA